jgi:hypothetical protein
MEIELTPKKIGFLIVWTLVAVFAMGFCLGYLVYG